MSLTCNSCMQIILKSRRETHCHYCFSEAPVDVVFCPLCTIPVYCSRKCQEQAVGGISWNQDTYLESNSNAVDHPEVEARRRAHVVHPDAVRPTCSTHPSIDEHDHISIVMMCLSDDEVAAVDELSAGFNGSKNSSQASWHLTKFHRCIQGDIYEIKT